MIEESENGVSPPPKTYEKTPNWQKLTDWNYVAESNLMNLTQWTNIIELNLLNLS